MAEKIGLQAVLEMASFNSAMRQYLGKIDTMSNRTARVASSVTSSFGSIGASVLKLSGLAAGAGFAGLALGLGAVASTGLDFNNTLEQASAKIMAFTKDSGKTAQLLEDIRVEAAKTPFEFQAMADATAGLLPAAKQSGEAIMNLVKDAEILAASNPAEGLEGAAFALREAVSGDFTSIIERFNLPRTMINKLKEEGLPALEIVRRAMGEMGFDMDLVSNLANTASGRWSTFKDTLTNLSGTLTEPIFTEFSTGLGTINDLLAQNEPKLTAIADLMAGKMAEGITIITQKAGELMSAFASGGTGGLLAALGIGPEGIALFEKVSTLITGLADAISTALLPALQNLSGSGVMATINDGLGFINQHFAEFQGALIGIGAILGTGVLVALASAIAGLVTPVTLLIAAGATLGAAWAGNWFNIQGVAQQALAVLTTVFSTLSAIALSLVNTITNNVLPPLREAFNSITQALNNMGIQWSDVWNALVTATKIVASVIGIAILGLIGTITGLVTGFATAFATITSYAVEFQNHIVALFTGLMQAGKGFIDFFTGVFTLDLKLAFDGLKTLVTGVLNTLKAAFNLALTSIQASLGGLLSFVKGWMSSFTGFFDGLAPALGEKFENTWKTIRKVWKPERWFELGQSVIEGILEGIKKSQDLVLEMLKDLAKKALSSAMDALGAHSPSTVFMDVGKTIPQGLAAGISANAGLAQNALDTLMTGLKVTDQSFIDKFIDDLNMGGIAKAAGTGGGQWKNFRNILKNEITANMQGLADGSINFMQHITDVAARFHFPANLAREFAKAQGLVEHLTGTFAIMFQKLRIENMAASIGIANNFSSIGSSFADMIQSQIDAFEKSKEATAKLSEEGTKLSEVSKGQQEKLAELKAELLKLTTAQEQDTEAISKKQNEITELTKDIEANSKAVEANRIAIETARQKLMQSVGAEFMADATDAEKIAGELAKIQLLSEFLAGDQNQLTIASKLQTVYGEVLVEQHLDRVKAQEELNKLTAEQARREQEIIRQREAQAKLDFLGQQINLIKLISDRGLNPRDILGGITLGLQAGATDLLAATNKVVEAMVTQINQDLQMGSPSRLMIKTFKQVMAGAAIGMERGQSMLSDAVRSIPILNGSIPQPVFSQAGGVSSSSSTTYNYNFPMTVNTAATAPAVVRQYEIKRSMYAN